MGRHVPRDPGSAVADASVLPRPLVPALSAHDRRSLLRKSQIRQRDCLIHFEPTKTAWSSGAEIGIPITAALDAGLLLSLEPESAGLAFVLLTQEAISTLARSHNDRDHRGVRPAAHQTGQRGDVDGSAPVQTEGFG